MPNQGVVAQALEALNLGAAELESVVGESVDCMRAWVWILIPNHHHQNQKKKKKGKERGQPWPHGLVTAARKNREIGFIGMASEPDWLKCGELQVQWQALTQGNKAKHCKAEYQWPLLTVCHKGTCGTLPAYTWIYTYIHHIHKNF